MTNEASEGGTGQATWGDTVRGKTGLRRLRQEGIVITLTKIMILDNSGGCHDIRAIHKFVIDVIARIANEGLYVG